MPTVGQFGLIALFVTALVTAQVTASKLIAVSVPFTIPVAGSDVALPAAAFAYAVTYFASDCFSELYGKRAAQRMVNIGFLMNLVLLALIWLAIAAPASPAGIEGATFEQVLGASTNITIGSLVAYLISQNTDVVLFHSLRELTAGDHLWLRNIASTATSQALDTIVFITLGFSVVPALLGIGSPLPAAVLAQLVIGQYVLKLAIAVIDTPVVYGVVSLIRESETSMTAAPAN